MTNNHHWNALNEDRLYRNQRMEEAERERLAKDARDGRPNQRFYRSVLAGMGSRMVAWGVELQLRYGNIHVGDASDLRRVRLSLQERAR